MMETRYQRVAREQAERQAARAEREETRVKASRITARTRAKISRHGKRERAYLEYLVSDHNHDMDG